MRPNGLAALALAILLVPVTSGASGRWIHVRVDEKGPNGEKVRVNVPLSMVRTILPLLDDGDLHAGKIRLNEHDVDAVKLRAIWKAVREAEEGEYVTVEGDDENVRVSRNATHLLVDVDDRNGDDDDVTVKVPLPVMDALLSGTGDQLDIVAAIDALDLHGDGEIVRVEGNDENVRIWVDTDHSGEGRQDK